MGLLRIPRLAHTCRLRSLPGSVHSREQADLLSALEPAVREWGAARDRGEHDSDDPPAEILGLFAALALRDGGADNRAEDEDTGLMRGRQGRIGAVMAGMDRPVGLGRTGSSGSGGSNGSGSGRGGDAGNRRGSLGGSDA